MQGSEATKANLFPLSRRERGKGEWIVVEEQTVESRLKNAPLEKYARELRHNQADSCLFEAMKK
jgi:hypothetical protein